MGLTTVEAQPADPSADWHRVLTRARFRPISAFVVLLGVVLSACGADPISRNDAITALQTTGVSAAEATCMADSLVALQRLDAADPRIARTDESREALVSVNARCVTPEVLGSTVTQSADETVDDDELADLPFTPSAQSTASTEDAPTRRDAAVARLIELGRTRNNAACVVDHLVGAFAEDVFDDPNFGLGLDPFEATAFAACA